MTFNLSRRTVIASLAAAVALPAFPALAAEEGTVSQEELAKPGKIPDISLGKPDAPVKVYEYASLTCSHCAHFAKESFPEIRKKYIDTGKVFWTMREFPLDPRAAAGVVLARCISTGGSAEKYYNILDVLFSQQENWAFVDGSQVLPSLQKIALQAGATQQQFEACLKDQALYDGVMSVRERAVNQFKIDSTPTFFINGKIARGALSPEQFAAIVDPLLK